MKRFELQNYKLTKLDEMVIRFTKILEKYTKYVIVSGYIAILFGNTRPTIDVDIIYEKLEKKDIKGLVHELKNEGFEFIDIEEEIFDILEIRKEKINIFDSKTEWQVDFKKAKSIFDKKSIGDRIEVVFNNKAKIYVAPIELQICYKLALLGSDKDIKDASYLYNYFEKQLDKEKLKEYAEMTGADLSIFKTGD